MPRLLQTSTVAALLTIATVPSAWAQNAAACQSVEFSSFVLERAPHVRDACLDVITRGGEQFAVIKSDLIGATPNTLRVRLKRPDGTPVESRSIRVRPGFRVLVDGKPTRIEDLAIGQELTAYVKVTEPVLTLQPGTEEEPLEPEPAPVQEEPEAVAATVQPLLPQTASALPITLIGGLVLMFVACVLGTLDYFVFSRPVPESGAVKEQRGA